MAIVVKIRSQHRCTDCGEKWWPDGKGEWIPCTRKDEHPCPSCQPETPKVECMASCHFGGPVWDWIYCPRCAVALKTKEG